MLLINFVEKKVLTKLVSVFVTNPVNQLLSTKLDIYRLDSYARSGVNMCALSYSSITVGLFNVHTQF